MENNSELELVVSRECDAIRPDGTAIKTIIGVTRPIHVDKWTWSVTTTMGDIAPDRLNVTGVDSWHAMQMGMYNLYGHLKALQSGGWRFSWLDGEEHDVRILLAAEGREQAKP